MKTKQKRQNKEQAAAGAAIDNRQPQQPSATAVSAAPVIKVKTNIKAGHYLSFTIGAGATPTTV